MWREPLRVKYMCDNKCNKEDSKFHGNAAILAEDDGKPHTINFCRTCCNFGLAERNESKVTTAKWKPMIEQNVSRGKLSAAFGWVKGCRDDMQSESCGEKICWRRQRERCRWKQAGRMRHRTRRSLS